MKKISLMLAAIGVLTVVSIFALAETPDECAARLDQSIAVKTFDEAAAWWVLVQESCGPQPETTSTPEPPDTCDPATVNSVGLYFGCGELEFCVMTPTLNIRSTPGGTTIGSLSRGDMFTVDRATLERANGYVWGNHEKGWSAIEGLGIGNDPYPQECPEPTPQPTRVSIVRSASQTETLRIGQTKTFHLSGADCAITASSTAPGKLFFAAGRMGWLQDQFMVDIYAPRGGRAMSYFETQQDGGAIGRYSHQFYTPDFVNFSGDYTVEVSTFTESQSYRLQVNNKATYNIAVACE